MADNKKNETNTNQSSSPKNQPQKSSGAQTWQGGSPQTSGLAPGAKTESAKDAAREHMSEPMSDLSERAARGFIDTINQAMPEDLSKAIDQQIVNMPPAGFLGVALGAMGVSATLALFNERKGLANFFGAWVPSLLFLTVYAKLLKLERSLQQEGRNPMVH